MGKKNTDPINNNNKESHLPLIMFVPIILLLLSLIILIIALLKNKSDDNMIIDDANTEDSREEEYTEDYYSESSSYEGEEISKEEFDALPDDEKYIDYKNGSFDIIPGIVPTKEQALSYLYERADYAFSRCGVFSAMPAIYDDPWEAEDGGWCCYVYNEYGTTVLRAYVDIDGEIHINIYGSQYVKDFIGTMYNLTDTTQNPDAETLAIIEQKIYDKYGNAKKLMLKTFDGSTAVFTNHDGDEVIIEVD